MKSYLDSSLEEAIWLFLGSWSDDRHVLDLIQQVIEWLQQVNRTSDGCRDVINENNLENLCSPNADIFFILGKKCSILS